jgi:hypothetical protein
MGIYEDLVNSKIQRNEEGNMPSINHLNLGLSHFQNQNKQLSIGMGKLLKDKFKLS